MPLSDKDKTEARDAIALALELNEPETMIEGLRRLCERKANEAQIGDNEANRWRSAHDALKSVADELERANAPQTRANAAQEPQAAPPADS